MFDTYDKIFAKRADQYHEAMALCPGARAEEFKAIVDLAALSPDQTVVDAPAGGGYLHEYLDDKTHYVAVETAEYFFLRCPQSGNRDRVLCDLEEITFPTEIADCVVSLAAMHHVNDRRAVYEEFYRLAKPNGTLILADVDSGSPTDQFLNHFVNAGNSMGHKGVFLSPNDFELLQSVGFSLESNQLVNLQWHFSSEIELSRFAKSLFGLDLVDTAAIFAGVQKTLGTESSADGVRMNWPLRYIRATKPDPR